MEKNEKTLIKSTYYTDFDIYHYLN